MDSAIMSNHWGDIHEKDGVEWWQSPRTKWAGARQPLELMLVVGRIVGILTWLYGTKPHNGPWPTKDQTLKWTSKGVYKVY